MALKEELIKLPSRMDRLYFSLENNNLLNLHSVNKIFEYSAAVNVVEKT